MRKEKGSITIFSLISLLLITATLFALLEGTRYQEIQRFARLQTEVSLESVFSNYNMDLWETYHLLGAEVEDVEGILEWSANGRTGASRNLLSFQAKDIQMTGYTVLTDGQGTEYIRAVSAYMKDNLLYETAKEIYNQHEVIRNLLNSSEVDLSNIEEALKEIETVTQTEASTSVGTSKKLEDETEVDIVALLKEAQSWKENGVLNLVIKDTSKLSQAEVDFANGLLTRQLEEGNNVATQETDWIDVILLQQYLLTYMSNYQETQEGRALSYEAEYLLGGRSKDKENLQIVVSKLFAIREAANFLYLISHPMKNQQAETLAMTIGGPSLNPIIIKVIKVGLLTAWALAESILDVRALLDGKKIPLLKSDKTWTLELENIGQINDDFSIAKESEWGLGYENYLGILLLFEEEQELAMRAMNIQEAALRKMGNASIKMDRLMTEASVEIGYCYAPIFPFLQVIDAEHRWEYEIFTNTKYGYYQ